ncbi:hypothetical protein [Alginatibacterium sediminis]|uniref:hypothetical protein n=1 Tax=Alginatibacterium sediminis TaxID=2164068 RepID=UPI0013143454|nr:hypothetical protein [Alginatibacterium sediminis]
MRTPVKRDAYFSALHLGSALDKSAKRVEDTFILMMIRNARAGAKDSAEFLHHYSYDR